MPPKRKQSSNNNDEEEIPLSFSKRRRISRANVLANSNAAPPPPTRLPTPPPSPPPSAKSKNKRGYMGSNKEEEDEEEESGNKIKIYNEVYKPEKTRQVKVGQRKFRKVEQRGFSLFEEANTFNITKVKYQDRLRRFSNFIVSGEVEMGEEEAPIPFSSPNLLLLIKKVIEYVEVAHEFLLMFKKGGLLVRVHYLEEDKNGVMSTVANYITFREILWNLFIEARTTVDQNSLFNRFLSEYNRIAEKFNANPSNDKFKFIKGFEIYFINREGSSIPRFKGFDPTLPISEIRGFCNTGRGKTFFLHGHIFQTHSSKDNECFIACCLFKLNNEKEYFSKPGFKKRFLEAIELDNFDNGFPLSKLKKAAKFFGRVIEVYSFNNNELVLLDSATTKEGENKTIIKLLLKDNHFSSYIGICDPDAARETQGVQCNRCLRYFKKEHICDRVQCTACLCWIKEKRMSKHNCNIHSTNWVNSAYQKKQGKDVLYSNVDFQLDIKPFSNTIIFDFETLVDEEIETRSFSTAGIHKAYAVGWYFKDEEDETKSYNRRYGYDSVNAFIEWMDYTFEAKANYTLIGYNNSGYDNHLLLQAMVQRDKSELEIRKIKPVIHSGNMICLEFKTLNGGKVRVIDLFRFITEGKLKGNCEAFGLTVEKGDFPYRFINSQRDINYVGDIPSVYWWEELPKDYDPNEEGWSLKEKCLEYLDKDVLCTKELYRVFSETIFNKFKVDLRDYLTLSHMSYSIWSAMVSPNTNYDANTFPFAIPVDAATYKKITFPNINQYKKMYKATYGGRVYPVKNYFKSSKFDKIMSGELGYNDLIDNDHLLKLDIVSMYASCMQSNLFPIGEVYDASDRYLADLNAGKAELKIGIYKIKYITNKKLIIPVLPSRKVKKDEYGRYVSEGLEHNLIDGTGYYTSVDIENALDAGYKIEYLNGIYWEESAYIFKEFIDMSFAMKKEGVETGNKALEKVAKLFGNGLYGKMLQKPNLDVTKIVTGVEDANKFLAKHILEDIIYFDNNEEGNHVAAIFKGIDPNLEENITKPMFGPFVLAYSRKLAQKYMKIFNPEIYEDKGNNLLNTFWYTDTDCFHILMNEKKKENIKEYYNKTLLGGLWNDDKEGLGKVIESVYVGPKTYLTRMICKDGSIKVDMKCKGIPRSCLKESMYYALLNSEEEEEEIQRETVIFSSFKKTGLTRYQNNDPFTVLSVPIMRSFLKERYKKRMFINDDYRSSYPFGYENDININNNNQ